MIADTAAPCAFSQSPKRPKHARIRNGGPRTDLKFSYFRTLVLNLDPNRTLIVVNYFRS